MISQIRQQAENYAQRAIGVGLSHEEYHSRVSSRQDKGDALKSIALSLLIIADKLGSR